MLERSASEPLAGQGGEALPAGERGARMLVAEATGAGALTFLVVATGILSERYAGGNIALAILTTALAAAAGFAGLARAFAGLAPSLFNPAFAVALALSGRLPLVGALTAGAAQMAAACAGVMLAHIVTNTGRVQVATQIQTGLPVWLGEFIAGALVIFVLLRVTATTSRGAPLFGGLALLAAALATPSLSLANPAITLARGLTDSFTSIRLEDAGLIVACQFAGALVAALASAWLFPGHRDQL